MSIKLIDRGVAAISVTDTASSIAGDPKNNLNNVSSTGQIVAAVGSFTPFGALTFSPTAAVLTSAKIADDYNNGRPVSPGDVLSVTGNVIVVVGTVGALATGASVAVPR